MAGLWLALYEIDQCVEIALRLKIVQQVLLPFQQEAAVYRALLINGNQLAQLMGGDVCSGHFHLDDGSHVDIKNGRHAIGFGMEFKLLKRGACQRSVILLEGFLHFADPALEAAFRHLAPAWKSNEKEPAAPIRGANEALRRDVELAQELDAIEAGALAGTEEEIDVGFLRGGSAVHMHFNARRIEP